MAHGIMSIDKGFVNAVSTWHGLDQYVCIPDRPITMQEAISVADYGIEKIPLYRMTMDGAMAEVEGAHCIIRSDTQNVLVPTVGDRFHVESNTRLLNVVDEHLMAIYPDLQIESVGTLWGGATFFLNLKVGEYQIKTDKSPTIANLMYCNPLGKGAYTACAHNTRIVCANTERMAELQGMANGSLKKFRHTISADAKINEHLIDMAELKVGLKAHTDLLNGLADQEVSVEEVDAFLNKIMPVPEKEGRGKTVAENNRTAFLNIFEGVQKDTLSNPYTKYGFYQAFTDWVDHEKTSRNADDASIKFDGIMGVRSDQKEKVLAVLTA